MGAGTHVCFAGSGNTRDFVLLLGFCPWWPQQLVLGSGFVLTSGWVVHSHEVPLRPVGNSNKTG